MSILDRNVWCILGLPFDVATLAGAIDKVEDSAKASERLFFTTPNLNFLITALTDPIFFQSVVESGLIVADGMPIIWMAKLLGVPLTERVAGADLFAGLSPLKGRNKKISVFFFGGEDGVAEKACQRLNESSQAVSCCGYYNPGFESVKEMSSAAIIDKINVTHPDFLVVALGARKGQYWIQKNRHKLNATIISHLGAVVNFVAGSVQRAPEFWQRYGLEWLWRIKQERILWRRYLFDGLTFVRLILLKALPLAFYDRMLKRSELSRIPVIICREDPGRNIIKLSGSVHYAALEPVKRSFEKALISESGDVILNCSNLVYIDSSFIGTLLLFQSVLNEQGRQLCLQQVSRRVMRLLDFNIVLNRFQIESF